MIVRMKSIREAWGAGVDLDGIDTVTLSGKGYSVTLGVNLLHGLYYVSRSRKECGIQDIKMVPPNEALQALKDAADTVGCGDKVTLLTSCLILSGNPERHLAYDSFLDRIVEV